MPWSGTAQQLFLDRLDRGPGGRAAANASSRSMPRQVEAHREDRGEPADGAGQVGARHHLLLAAVAFEVDQRRADDVDPAARAPAGERQRQRGEQSVVDAAVEGLRERVVSSASVTSAGTPGTSTSDGLGDVDCGSSGRDPSERVGAVEHPPPQVESRPCAGSLRRIGEAVRPPAHRRADAGSRAGSDPPRPAPRRGRGRGRGSATTPRRPPGGGRRSAAARGGRCRAARRTRPPAPSTPASGSSRPAAASSSRDATSANEPAASTGTVRDSTAVRPHRADRGATCHRRPSLGPVTPVQPGAQHVVLVQDGLHRAPSACPRPVAAAGVSSAAGSTGGNRRRCPSSQCTIGVSGISPTPPPGSSSSDDRVCGARPVATSASAATVLALEHVPRGEHHPGRLRPGDQLDRHDAVAAEREERIVDAHRFEAEHLGEQTGEDPSPSPSPVRGRATPGRPKSGSGSALRSSLPFAVSGSASSTTRAAGTMYAASRPATERRRSRPDPAPGPPRAPRSRPAVRAGRQRPHGLRHTVGSASSADSTSPSSMRKPRDLDLEVAAAQVLQLTVARSSAPGRRCGTSAHRARAGRPRTGSPSARPGRGSRGSPGRPTRTSPRPRPAAPGAVGGRARTRAVRAMPGRSRWPTRTRRVRASSGR